MTDKAIALCVLSVLKNSSDKSHPLNATEISDNIARLYGLSPDRRTIYAAVETLREFDYNITKVPRGYYLYECGVDNGIVKLLLDAVNYFPFLTAAQTNTIKQTITETLPMRDKQSLPSITISNSRKALGAETLQSIAALTSAIQTKKQVSFDYLKYGYNEHTRAPELQPRAAGRITAHPYALDFFNSHYYLICYNPGHPEKPSNLRVDRMRDVTVLPDDAVRKFNKEALEKAVQHSAYGFTGDEQSVTLKVDQTGLTCVIDEFGTDLNITRFDEDHLRVVFTASTHGMVYFALQYLEHVEVIYPLPLRDEIRQMLQNNPYTK